MKIVVDTNVILSSLLGPRSNTLNRLLDQIRISHTLVMSLAMAVELGAVIVRPKFSHLGTEKERAVMAQALVSAPHFMAMVPTFTMVHPDLSDPDDNRLLEVAIEANADLIITGDKAVLSLGSINKPVTIDSLSSSSFSPIIPIMNVGKALDYLSSSGSGFTK